MEEHLRSIKLFMTVIHVLKFFCIKRIKIESNLDKSNAHRPPQRRCLQIRFTERRLITSSKNTSCCLNQRPTQITGFPPGFSHTLNTNMIFWGLMVGLKLVSNGLNHRKRTFVYYYYIYIGFYLLVPYQADFRFSVLEFFVPTAHCGQMPHGGDRYNLSNARQILELTEL